MMPLVGWQQDFSPKNTIDHRLTQSESGLYYQQAHPLVTTKNVRSIMPEDFIEQYNSWNEFIIYDKGAKVRHEGIVWIAMRETQGEEPEKSAFNGDYSDDFDSPSAKPWKPYNMLSDYLLRMTQQAITQVVQTFLTKKSLLKESKALLERRPFFDGAGRIDNIASKGQKIVGFEITPVRAMGVTTKIERIGLQMTGATGDVTVYLFHSSQRDPVQMVNVHISKGNGSMEWFDLTDWFLPYISEHNDAGGSWYLCYNQADIPAGMDAINVARDWSRDPCGTCNRGNLEAWRELTKYIQIAPFRVPALETFAEYPELWDIEQMVYTNTQNYGLNVVVSVACDLTDFIVSQRSIFATVLQKQMAATVLRTLALNPDVRVNRNQSNASQFDLLYEVDGNPQGRKTGLGKEIEDYYDALDIDTRGIDRICLTCRPVGVRYTHV